MRVQTIEVDHAPRPAVRRSTRELVLVDSLLGRRIALFEILEPEVRRQVDELLPAAPKSTIVGGDPRVLAPYRHPRKILGIGLNYRAHASDLGVAAPRTTPASFFKGDHTIIAPGEAIRVPSGIGRVTAEAELGLVIGRECYDVKASEALSYVAGVCCVLDQTAESVLMENPRYLTRAKNYPSFFSFGPELISIDEVLSAAGNLSQLSVATVLNGEVRREALVEGMIFSPAELLSFHSQIMPFFPGDILLTGTPGAVEITQGDVVECVLGDGLSTLKNTVLLR